MTPFERHLTYVSCIVLISFAILRIDILAKYVRVMLKKLLKKDG